MTLRRFLLLCAAILLVLPSTRAAGPRWVTTGQNWYSDGRPVVWYQGNVSYFIDAGPLSSSVSNAAAARIVDAAAQVWNVPYSTLTLANGGSLNEDVSSANVYLGSSGPIWPADVDSSNNTSKQIAVVFDTDGTLIDMLLGSGASSPSSCRQNAAVENVDKFIQPGSIAHAIILLNGRCTGPAPEQQMQMQYQLMRIFGRVLGLAWSQVNDNVFTGAPAPTYQQQLHWPIMHPIDIVCGIYSYQCLPDPFNLRDDDRCAMHLLYGVGVYTPTDGETLLGSLLFPTGEGMEGVNMVATRQGVQGQYGVEGWQTTSAVTGALYRRNSGNPVGGALSTFPALQGSLASQYQGYWLMAQVPALPGSAWNNVLVTAEPVNPLYRGDYAVGPTASGAILPSGTVPASTFTVVGRYGAMAANVVVGSAASDCSTGSDGTAAAPAPVVSGGQWSGKICGYGHTSWGSFPVQAGRSATLEVMALDGNGATTGRLQPVLGMWHGSDATSTLPTLASAGTPFNGRQTGTTQLTANFTRAETVRFVVADQRGGGRPDFAYSARLLYADTVSPSRLGNAGGTIVITGTGFQTGNTVTVGGVAATVVSLSSTQIVAIAPSLTTLNGVSSNDLKVTDLRTGGTTTIAGGLLYGGSTGDVLTVVQAPAAAANVGAPGTFSVRLTNSSNAAVAGITITFRVTAGAATLAPCGAATCTATTDATGLAQVQAAATSAGAVLLQATTSSGAQAVTQFIASVTSQSVSAVRATEYVAAVPGAAFTPGVVLLSNGSRTAGAPVQWAVASGSVTLGGAQSSMQGTSAADGTALAPATANLQPGAQAVVQACAWSAVCTDLTIVGVSADALRIQGVSGDAQVVSRGSRLGSMVLRVVDSAGNGVAGATVSIRQQVVAWQPPCPPNGRCAVPAVYGTAFTIAISDDDGLVVVSPLQYDGTAATTRIVAATGTAGYLATELTKQP